jgi:F-type H+-transporting ATPase subunit epsilon
VMKVSLALALDMLRLWLRLNRALFITGGFADVTGEICTILAETAIDVANLDEAELNASLSTLEQDLGLAEEAIDKARIEKRIKMVKAQLTAVTGTLVL